jgi:spore maturation protein CgeB
MKLLYVGLLYNYGKEAEGYSYEHQNLEAGLKQCAYEGMFDVDYLYPDQSADIRRATETILEGDYDAVFHVAFNEELDFPEQAAKIALKKDIPVIQWDCDSSWRFGSWVMPRKHRVSHFITTHSNTIPWYEHYGMKVIRSQWGGSPSYVYEPDAEKKYDVSFVGQKHGQMPDGKFLRAEIIDAIQEAGIKVDLWGNYWDGYECWHGYERHFPSVLSAFNESKICLNLSNPWHHGTMPQIKGRHFEIPQIGQFQLATPADDLQSYFEFGKEIEVASSIPELIEKLKYYLEHDEEREAIARAGHERMLAEHQWKHRFQDIFSQIGIL